MARKEPIIRIHVTSRCPMGKSIRSPQDSLFEQGMFSALASPKSYFPSDSCECGNARMHQFQLQPLQRFASDGQNTATIRRPRVKMSFFRLSPTLLNCIQEIAHFSFDDDHKLHLDDRSLKYYYTPRLGADLSRGKPTFSILYTSL